MRLSEAIRLGAMLRPQNYGNLYVDRPRGILGLTTARESSCAIGAAYEAAGVRPTITIAEKGEVLGGFRGEMRFARGGEQVTTYQDPWYAFSQTVHACPACDKQDALELHRLIPHLNDEHKWTRERIADFVETLESQPADVAVGLSVDQPVAVSAR